MKKIISGLVALSALFGAPAISSQELAVAPDTISEQEPIEVFKRDLETIPFVPKGQWITGVSVNYSASKQDNYQFLIIENLSGDSYSFKISPTLLYSFKDNMAAGGRFSYTRELNKLNSADVMISSDMNFNVDNLYSISNNYYAAALYRYYVSMGKSKRFGFVTEVQLQLGGGQSKLCTGTGSALSGTYQTNFNLNVGISPGIVMFLSNYSAIEVNVGLLGFNYVSTKATTDQIYVSNRNSHSANFNINLFSISFGVLFYL